MNEEEKLRIAITMLVNGYLARWSSLDQWQREDIAEGIVDDAMKAIETAIAIK